MKKLYPLVLSTVFMATALVAPLAAQNNQNQPPQGPSQGQRMGRQNRGQGLKAKLQERFGLTDEQMQKIEDAKKNQQKVMMETRARENVLKAEMEYLWVGEKVDKNAIMAKFTEMEKLKRKAFTAGVDFKMTVANMLTADQRQEVMELLQKRRNKRQGGHQRFGRNNQMSQRQNFNRGFRNQQFNRSGGFHNSQQYNGYPQGGGYNNGGYGPQRNFGGYGPQGGYGNQGGYGGYDDRGYDFDNVTDGDL